MVYLHDLVRTINEVIGKRLSKYSRAEYFGIATQAIKNENGSVIAFPSIISADGLSKVIEYSKKPPFLLYHRAYTSTFSFSATQTRSYGDGDLVNQRCDTLMKIICTGNRKDIVVTAEEFAMIIVDCLPTNVTIDNKTNIRISPINIQYDSRIVFNGEFEKLSYFIGPDSFLFSIQYNISGGYLKGCLVNCDC